MSHQYPQGDEEPQTLRQMHALMAARAAGQPAPQIADPATIAVELIYRIYMAMKNKVLLGDRQPDSIGDALREARARTLNEVAHLKLRQGAVDKYDKMLERLTAGGEIQL